MLRRSSNQGNRRFIAPSVAALVLGPTLILGTPTAEAQVSTRNVMSRNDNGAMSTLTYSVPDRGQLTAVDLRPADMPEVASRLDLSESQAMVVRDLVEAYADAVAALELDVPERGESLLGDGGGGAAAPGGSMMTDAVREAMVENGFDPSRLDGELSVGIGIGVGMNQSGDGPPEPEVNVNISIGPEEGRTLPKDEIDRLKTVAQQAAEKIEAIARDQAIEDFMAQLQGGPSEDDTWDQLNTRASEMRASIRAYKKERLRLRRELDAGIQAILAESQMARWPAFDRWVLRNVALGWGRLSGEQVDVFAAMDDLAERRPDTEELLAGIREGLEIQLHQALARRADEALEASMQIDEAVTEGDGPLVRRNALRVRDLHVRVRDVNLRAIDMMGSVLSGLPIEPDPFVEASDDRASASEVTTLADRASAGRERVDLGDHVRYALRREAFGSVWAETPAQRAFAAVDAMELSPEQRTVAEEVAFAYGSEHQSASERIEAIVLKHDPESILRSHEGLLENLGAEALLPAADEDFDDADGGGMRISLSRRSPVTEALERRLVIDKRAMRRLYGMFDSSVLATLPALPEVEDLAPIEGRAGSVSVPSDDRDF